MPFASASSLHESFPHGILAVVRTGTPAHLVVSRCSWASQRRNQPSHCLPPCRDKTEHGGRFSLLFETELSEFHIQLDRMVPLLQSVINNEPLPYTLSRPTHRSAHYRLQAFDCLETCLVVVLGIRSPREAALECQDPIELLREAAFGAEALGTRPSKGETHRLLVGAGSWRARVPPDLGSWESLPSLGCAPLTARAPSLPPARAPPRKAWPAGSARRIRYIKHVEAERELCLNLLTTLLTAVADPELSERARPLLDGVLRHLALLIACRKTRIGQSGHRDVDEAVAANTGVSKSGKPCAFSAHGWSYTTPGAWGASNTPMPFFACCPLQPTARPRAATAMPWMSIRRRARHLPPMPPWTRA